MGEMTKRERFDPILQSSLLQVYRKRLVDESIITEMSAKNIFSGLDDLYTMQRGFLDKFESLVSVGSWNEDTTPIGSLFIDYVRRVQDDENVDL